MRKLDADTEAIWQERRALVEEVRRLAGRLEEIATEAAERFPERQSRGPPEDEMPTVAVSADELGDARPDDKS